jgi:hypothetical protein
MTLAVSRSNWQVQENREDSLVFNLSRIYEFADPRAPATLPTLKITCPVRIAERSGHIYSPWLEFELRPHLCLRPGQLPDDQVIDNLDAAIEHARASTVPFSVWLITAGEGTETSPLLEGGVGCKALWHGDEDEEDPESLRLTMMNQPDVIQCLKVLASGKEMTFTIMGDTEPSNQLLQLRLANDEEFRRLWDDVRGRLIRQLTSNVGTHRYSPPASEGHGPLGHIEGEARLDDPFKDLERSLTRTFREMETTAYPTDHALLEQARRSKGHISYDAVLREYHRLMWQKLHPWRSLWSQLTGR